MPCSLPCMLCAHVKIPACACSRTQVHTCRRHVDSLPSVFLLEEGAFVGTGIGIKGSCASLPVAAASTASVTGAPRRVRSTGGTQQAHRGGKKSVSVAVSICHWTPQVLHCQAL